MPDGVERRNQAAQAVADQDRFLISDESPKGLDINFERTDMPPLARGPAVAGKIKSGDRVTFPREPFGGLPIAAGVLPSAMDDHQRNGVAGGCPLPIIE